MQDALQRQAVLESVARGKREGLSDAAACRVAGITHSTYIKWRNAWAKSGREGLETKLHQCGRKPDAVLNEEEQNAARHLNVKLESGTQALRMLADMPLCRPEIAEVIRRPRSSKHTLTPTLRAQAEVPQQVINWYKSPKRTGINCFINPRTLTYIDAGGAEQALTPGDLWERDDMSNNFLCTVDWPWGGCPCSEKFGVKLVRGQNLLGIDVAALFFLSFNFLIRPKDSYRADDIWQWVATTYRDIGMPRIGERWERGTWATKRLRGDPDATIEVGHTEEAARLGGMAALGLRVIESQSPTTKIIENRFNFLQRVMATIPGQIGRKRGEFERATKLWMECREGRRDPREHFLTYEKCCDEIEARLHYVNAEKVEGYIYNGIPAALWQQGIEAAPLEVLQPEQGWLFSRDKTQITAAKAHVMIRFTRDDKSRGAHWFHHENLWHFEGEKIGVYYDSYLPDAGATLICQSGRRVGEVIGHAEYIQGAPQFSLASGFVPEAAGYGRRRDFTDAVISETRTLGLRNTLSRSRTADNGAGARTQISSSPNGEGMSAPLAEAASGGGRPDKPGDEDAVSTPPLRSGGLASILFDA